MKEDEEMKKDPELNALMHVSDLQLIDLFKFLNFILDGIRNAIVAAASNVVFYMWCLDLLAWVDK